VHLAAGSGAIDGLVDQLLGERRPVRGVRGRRAAPALPSADLG